MNETEELIKAALAKHVEGTPHPGSVLTALGRRRRRIRPALIAIIAATAVAAGIAIPIALQKPEASAPPATQAPLPDETRGIKMRYGLKPLPGYVEVRRTSTTDRSHQTRMWSWAKSTCQNALDCSDRVSLSMYTSGHPYWAEVTELKGERVEVNGIEAWLSIGGRMAHSQLSWRPAVDTVLLLSVFSTDGNVRQAALDMARTVAVDDTAVVQPPLSFGWLPAELTRTSVTVTGSSPSTADAWIDAETTDPRVREVQAKIVAKAINSPENHTIAVTLKDGRQVQVMASGNNPLPLDQLRKIADNLAPAPAPDTSWAGS